MEVGAGYQYTITLKPFSVALLGKNGCLGFLFVHLFVIAHDKKGPVVISASREVTRGLPPALMGTGRVLIGSLLNRTYTNNLTVTARKVI